MRSSTLLTLSTVLVCASMPASSWGVNPPAPTTTVTTGDESILNSDRPAWIMFADKGIASDRERSQALDWAVDSMTPRARLRREQRRSARTLVDKHDLPVCPLYVKAVQNTGARIRVQSRWLNAVSVEASAEQVEAIRQLPFVSDIRPVAAGRRTPVPAVEEVDSGLNAATADFDITTDLSYGSSLAQLNQMNATALHDLGYTGAGVTLAVLDTGFYKDHEAIDMNRVVAEWDFVKDDGNTQNEAGDPSSQHNHGTTVASIAAAAVDGTMYGPAYEADLILCKTEDLSQEQPIEEDWYVAGLEFAELQGADVVTSSLGYIDWYTQSDLDGLTAVTTIAVNIATANGVFVCTAAGNEGFSGLIAPADAFDVITVGAVDSSGNLASFSSRGPTADGRVKPECVARGVSTYGARTSSPTSYGSGNGTSYATPLVAGVVCCLIQAHPDWTVSQMRKALFRTADYYLANLTHDPAHGLGYGLIDGVGALNHWFIPADFDRDEDIDLVDFSHLQACLGESSAVAPPECENARLDSDMDVDSDDADILLACLSGPNLPPAPACIDD